MSLFTARFLAILLVSFRVVLVYACGGHHFTVRQEPAPNVITYTTPQSKVAIVNVKVFDGTRLLLPSVVVIENGRIGIDPSGAEVIDAKGGVLLPGLIDSHVHTGFLENVLTMRDYGITSALDMGCYFGAEACNALNVGVGYPEIEFSYAGAISAYGQIASLGLFTSFITYIQSISGCPICVGSSSRRCFIHQSHHGDSRHGQSHVRHHCKRIPQWK